MLGLFLALGRHYSLGSKSFWSSGSRKPHTRASGIS
ncbi:hypothetical protein BT93_A1123 [Corymbia citriodora subsp. variegata]|nr:hypothetical protein BT93_A1123 [Corymbia citriodora subsp. variegata]